MLASLPTRCGNLNAIGYGYLYIALSTSLGFHQDILESHGDWEAGTLLMIRTELLILLLLTYELEVCCFRPPCVMPLELKGDVAELGVANLDDQTVLHSVLGVVWRQILKPPLDRLARVG